MGKRILVTSTDLMMVQFLLPHIRNLAENGYEVEIACSNVGRRMEEIQSRLDKIVKKIHVVRLHRSPVSLDNLNGYKDMKQIINEGHYDIIWTNEPVMGIMTRFAAIKSRKTGTKVVYITHGYHFCKGGQLRYKPFYLIERVASRFCDKIITINYEDFELTKRKFNNKFTAHINGIGLDTKKYSGEFDTRKKRRELGLPEDAFVVLSVGELKKHKNHKVIIKAIEKTHLNNIYYVICGKGELLEKLKEQARKSNIEDRVLFLGYREDINEIMSCVDVFAFPSNREGLGLAALEAMSSGLPIIGADTRGIVDYVISGETGYLCKVNDVDAYARVIEKLYMYPELRKEMSANCRRNVIKFDISIVKKDLLNELDKLLLVENLYYSKKCD